MVFLLLLVSPIARWIIQSKQSKQGMNHTNAIKYSKNDPKEYNPFIAPCTLYTAPLCRPILWGFFVCLQVKPSDLRCKEREKSEINDRPMGSNGFCLFVFSFRIASRMQTYSVHDISFHLHNRLSTTCTLRCCLAGYAFHEKGKFFVNLQTKTQKYSFFSVVSFFLRVGKCSMHFHLLSCFHIKCNNKNMLKHSRSAPIENGSFDLFAVLFLSFLSNLPW